MSNKLIYLSIALLILISGCGKPGYIVYNPGGFNTSGFDSKHRDKAVENIVAKIETKLPARPIGLVLVSDNVNMVKFTNIIFDKLSSHGADIKIINEKDLDDEKSSVDLLLYLYPVVQGERHIISFLVPPPKPQNDNDGYATMVWQVMMEGWGLRTLLGASAEARGSTVQMYMRLENTKSDLVDSIINEGESVTSSVGKEIKL